MTPEFSDTYNDEGDGSQVEVRVDYFDDRETNTFITLARFAAVQATPFQVELLHGLLGEVLADWDDMKAEQAKEVSA